MEKPAAYRGDGDYAFICYAHADSDQVFGEVAYLNANGVNTWYDEGIESGSEWSEYLANRLADAKTFIFFVSPASVASKHCRSEIQFAFQRAIPFVIVYLEKTRLSAGLELALGTTQALVKHELSEDRYRRKLIDAFLSEGVSSSRSESTVVADVAEEPASAPYQDPQQDAHQDKVAVLPFSNPSASEDDYFGAGIAEEILNRLGRASEIRVVARSSSFRFSIETDEITAIAAALGVSHVVEGTVRRAGNKVRVSANLIDGTDASQLWGDSYVRESEDIFDLQDDIAEAIANELQAQLVPSQSKSRSNQRALAHDEFLRGSHELWKGTRSSLYESIDRFNEAVNLDSDYADAYALLAYAYMLDFADPQADRYQGDNMRLFEQAATRALELDPNSDKANLSMAMFCMARQDWAESERYFIRALSINRNEPRSLGYYGYFLANTRRLQKGARYGAHAVEVDPYNCHELARKAQLFSYINDHETAIASAQRSLAIDPDYRTPHVWLVSAFSATGEHEEAIHSMTRWNLTDMVLRDDEAQEFLGVLREHGVPGYLNHWYQWLLAKRARGARTPHLHWFLAVYAALTRRIDEAFQYLDVAWQQSMLLPDFAFFAGLTQDPRWQALLVKHGLTDQDVVELEASATRCRAETGYIDPI